ncbi:unnamed protein product [Kuraishia capsulata CBS 1993]|uniref:Mannan polymerase II complex ANP1 subunit n=1 Tax=Kuraishia capsulata CBS 1993 TaxID=1382522 RepID=W6MFU9_9ASCO|nr:uncharacterized protein KUCA_T00000464001 [Kuraishia capsulata CBS 1993]CDK24501.1 unnamed protein product [Kuraishia capsulata CBS 1993]
MEKSFDLSEKEVSLPPDLESGISSSPGRNSDSNSPYSSPSSVIHHLPSDAGEISPVGSQEQQFLQPRKRHQRNASLSISPTAAGFAEAEAEAGASSLLRVIFWILYATLPLGILGYFLASYAVDYRHSNHSGSGYYPDLPSGYASKTGNFDDFGIEFYDLQDYRSTPEGWNRDERVLFCVPLRDASAHLPMFFGHMRNLTYPHNLIDLAFLISDTSDSTIKDLKKHLAEIQSDPDSSFHFGRINIYEKDFGQIIGQSFSDRHGFQAQGPRRKLMAIARNWLLSTALRPDHAWVYWRDADVETIPATIIEDLMHHDRDVIVPNIWRPLPDWLGYEQPYDLNSWQESEGGIELADRLDEDAVIVEGYVEYATWRPHLAYLRDANGDPEVEMELDGIGGVSILSKANVFKSGSNFPAFSFQKHAETEGFGKLCKRMGYSVIGLPHYTIWHIYEPSSDDLRHMEWMAQEEKRRLERAKIQKFYDKAWKLAFEEVDEDWKRLKFNVFKNTDLRKTGRKIEVDWSEVDEYLLEMDDEYNSGASTEWYDEEENQDPMSLFEKYDDDFKDKLEKSKKTDNPHEEVFNSFPLNPYVSGKNGKNYQFVKFRKGNGDDIVNSQTNDEERKKESAEMELALSEARMLKEEENAKKIEEENALKAEKEKEAEMARKQKLKEEEEQAKVLKEQEDAKKKFEEAEMAKMKEQAAKRRAEKLERQKEKKRKEDEEMKRLNQIAIDKEMSRREIEKLKDPQEK